MRRRTLALTLLLPSLVWAAPAAKPRKHGSGPVASAKEAKAIAEQDTGGRAVSARRVGLNGASGGWEVEVHMPQEHQGWRCIIDADTRMVHSKTRVEQPPTKGGAKGGAKGGVKGQSEGPLRVVKGRN
jgi:hypothetical protein